MPKYLLINLLCALSMISVCDPINAATDCPNSSTISCADRTKRISELPVGPIDGKNGVFALSRMPVDEKSVRIFINGLELTLGSAFQVKRQELIISTVFIPKPGSILRVSYEIGSSSVAPPSRSIATASSQEAIINQALLEAVLREEIPKVQTVASLDPTQSRSWKNRMPGATQKVTASVAMLARRIGEEAKSARLKSGNHEEPLSGFEGIGDLPVASPYSRLLGTEATEPNQLLASPIEKRRVVAAPRLRSLSILQQRLDSADQNEMKASKGGNK